MRILTYKRTHIGDPDSHGNFGVNDCMGRVRNWNFDAVIGVGGIGAEPKAYGIEGRITWVGRSPTWSLHPESYGQIVTFESFILLDERGPPLVSLAPNLARRMYENGARVLLRSYSQEEKLEAEEVISILLKSINPVASNVRQPSYRVCRKRFLKCRPC